MRSCRLVNQYINLMGIGFMEPSFLKMSFPSSSSFIRSPSAIPLLRVLRLPVLVSTTISISVASEY